MKIGVDARHLAGGRGVAQYTRGMLAALAEGFPQDEILAFVPGRAEVAEPAGVRLVRHPLPSRALFGAAALSGRPRLEQLLGERVDVVWVPAPAPVAVGPDTPYVLTVHDLSWLERPGDFTPYERAWHRAGRLRRLAERAAAVVADSQATGGAVRERWGLDAHVVYPGVTEPPGAGGPPPPHLPERFFLAVGALEPRKAPEILADAFRRARAQGLDADLVVAGSGRVAIAGDGIHVLGHVDALGPLYERATALVMPSRLEGFGFPPLEAALCGTPSILTDLPVFAETLGEAAVTVPVDDAGALARAMLAFDREAYAAPARAKAERFTPARAARALHAVLEQAAR